ncbi:MULTISPECIES: GGDEF domain-containing response regulator [unclassified Modicisalibacter]|uniref:GGDEF domain-containing response regulator n=1 Tax=unclassified Modicisalibacter TaxID=2679913 RepID=UPI001CCB3ACA|nr:MULTISPECIES: GGDEF domain-containing response regulator [unclassified Modicisalibacter]MBZ9557956.1 GGDEF domain-containing response regulator [Modicisalibacter sp. R2A 31.J]MBZ9573376.1 GGDEF domain-containing response regulator [Modicisalibacter sp. MOD 31.J]
MNTSVDDASRPVVLIVEDDPVGIASLAGILGGQFELVIARSVEEAKRVMPANVDLVLLDLYLDDQSGLSVLEHVRDRTEFLHTPVVVISGSDSEADIEGAFEKGAIDYVAKPFNQVILKSKVSTFIDFKKKAELMASAAYTDPLTAIANRRTFDEQLELEWRRALRHQAALSVLLIDLDNFKAINDTHGHQAGDQCLVLLAGLMKEALARAGDVVCRLGGDEFAAILPNTHIDQAVLVANRLRTAVVERGGAGASAPAFSVSIGCAAVVPTATDSHRELVEAADRALYRAKVEGGRNCVSPGPHESG